MNAAQAIDRAKAQNDEQRENQRHFHGRRATFTAGYRSYHPPQHGFHR